MQMAKSRSKKSPRSASKSRAAAGGRKVSRSAKPPPKSAPPKTTGKGKWVYAFGGGKAEGRAEMRNLLGGKGAGLAEMAHLGLPVPPGFTITTEVCTYYYENGKSYPEDLKTPGRGCAGSNRPYHRQEIRRREKSAAVSVRSGARVSMPGMMDTVLNLGLNDETVEGAGAKGRRPAVRL